jgi:hypothetical protein
MANNPQGTMAEKHNLGKWLFAASASAAGGLALGFVPGLRALVSSTAAGLWTLIRSALHFLGTPLSIPLWIVTVASLVLALLLLEKLRGAVPARLMEPPEILPEEMEHRELFFFGCYITRVASGSNGRI